MSADVAKKSIANIEILVISIILLLSSHFKERILCFNHKKTGILAPTTEIQSWPDRH